MSKEQTPICKCGNKAIHTYESLSKPKQVSLCEKCNETRAENLIKGHNYALKMKRTADELFDHYCSYNGIQDENKEELISIVNAKVLEALERERKISESLWILLDDIDTASDVFKPDNLESYKAFYDYAMKKQGERHKYLISDGYNLTTKQK